MTDISRDPKISIWMALLLPTLAGGLGWGIRGQFGHEQGAMVPGVLIALALCLLYLRRSDADLVARVAAFTAVGFSFGGDMTYGQTLGLSHGSEIRETAYWWGMLGVFIKGSAWIGLGGCFLGLGFSRNRVGPAEMFYLILILIVAYTLGRFLFNSPFDPPRLPRIYFSDYWGYDKPDWKPRPESWGGFWTALAVLLAYLAFIRRDRLSLFLGLFGTLFGGLGFWIGQTFQAWGHAHGPEVFSPEVNALIGWWKVMEITFGAVAGLGLGLGCWTLQNRIQSLDGKRPPLGFNIPDWGAAVIVFVWATCGMTWTFFDVGWVDQWLDYGFLMGGIPLVAAACGRILPYLVSLPMIGVYIAGNATYFAVFRNETIGPVAGALFFWFLPVGLLIYLAFYFACEECQKEGDCVAVSFSGLLSSAWIYAYLSAAKTHLWGNLGQVLAGPTENQTFLQHLAESGGRRVAVEAVFILIALSITFLAVRVRKSLRDSYQTPVE